MSIPTSHPIEACAAAIVGVDDNGDLLPGAVAWVERRLRRGVFPGYKAARRWRMTDDDIQAAIDSLRTRPQSAFAVTVTEAPAADRPLLSSMTRTSRRRMAVVT